MSATSSAGSGSQRGPLRRRRGFGSSRSGLLSGPAVRWRPPCCWPTTPPTTPPYRSEYLNRAYQLVGRDREEVSDNGARRYRRMLDFLDELMARAEARGLRISDRLDAQSLVWCVVVYGTERPPASEWPERLRHQYDAYLNGETVLPPAASAGERAGA